jgi:diacylglycerol O-acyltransferase
VVDQLSALDATFLELEEADQSAHMHIGGVIVLEPGPRGGAPPIEEIRRDVLARLPDLPRYTQRLSATHTGGLHWPSWEEDTTFRVERHVRRAGLPSPWGIEELREWAGEYYSQRLDRTKPLWEMTTLELADGRWAIVTKTHHCMIDGVGSVDMATTLLDTQPERRDSLPPASANGNPAPARDAKPSLPRWRRTLGHLSRPPLAAGHAMMRIGQAGVHASESAVAVATHPERGRDAAHRAKALAEVVVRDELVAAPSCSLNGPISAGRRLAVLNAELDGLKDIKNALGGTLNDVVLAAAAGGLRRLLIHRGEEPPQAGLRAMVPVNIRTAADRLAMGNRISSLFVHLPVAEADPRRRYELQVEEAEDLKAGIQATGSSTLVALTSHMPPVIHAFLARSMYATRLFNLTITNVPGPQQRLYAFGAPMVEVLPLVPLFAGHTIGIAVVSYAGQMVFGLNVDRTAMPDLETLAEGIQRSFSELFD